MKQILIYFASLFALVTMSACQRVSSTSSIMDTVIIKEDTTAIHGDKLSYDTLSSGFGTVKDGDKYAFVRKGGKIVGNRWYEWIGQEGDDRYPIKLDGKYGFADDYGNLLVKPQFDNAMSFTWGLAAVKLDGKWGFVDASGVVKIPIMYDSVRPFSQGLADVWLKGEKFSITKNNGKMEIIAFSDEE